MALLLKEEGLEARRNASDVAIKAGLIGLLSDEQQTFLETQSFPYHKRWETIKVDQVIKIVDSPQTENDKQG